MAELKTKSTNARAEDFLDTITPEQKRQDSFELLALFKKVTKKPPVMWGTSIVGFGKYHYKSERSRQEGDWPLVGFSPRKQNLTLYVIADFPKLENLLKKLGKHKRSVGCLYVNKLSDVDREVLEEIVRESFEYCKEHYK